MKVSKDAARDARRIFRLCTAEGRVDEELLRSAIQKIVDQKPRGYRGILHALKRLVRLDVESRRAVIESAVELDTPTRVQIEKDLTQTYGEGLSFVYRTDASLLGGLRIRVGNDVLDGSVQSRLNRLAEAF
ncbi:F0F1 ATP synthase subunit delta [Verrucomicrobiaceae bacterium N1E253]|uniref:F0F1 ATP synthase subunit delta n=1 Tax=Oceaniferula marina TaxID=2748318 RepID=A0A851GKS2_9BACT|nr:F0F1 ATP synthase subunit delta [Oceaniferula marina]NWK55687.1 F0F1 ATP synthase subunit delta [Oceaniferula marina]